jgi:ABC-type transport system involved in multi-copper enzyme maturation permease subunit
MIFTAYRLELFKMRKRLAAWVTYLCLCLLTTLTFGGQLYAAQHSHGRAYFGFPNALPTVLTGGTSIASIFGVVLIVLMVCNEFDWKTSRQNIIDGLSKSQWFAGKALLIPTVAVMLYLAVLVIGGTLAFIGTAASPPHGSDPTSAYLLAACGALLGIACNGSVALLVAMSVRSTGPALAIALIYQVFDTIAANVLRGLHLQAIGRYLPIQVQNSLLLYAQYLPSDAAARNHLDSHWQTGILFLVAAVWVTVLLSVSYRIYMKRDL